jgi:octaprenyl-diphosphate synthase
MQTFAPMRKKADAALAAREIFDLIKGELGDVEAEFKRQASSNIQVIDYLGEYLRASGGKRVRPALLLLANYAVGGDAGRDDCIRLATVMEMLHTATLVHDDIIDNADTRRSRASINARFGNQTAVLMGDWLYMSAFETTVAEGSLEIIEILTELTRKMTEGELIQLTAIGRIEISEDEYFDILRRKTAYLFSACCEIGAMLGGADAHERQALRDYGLSLGIAFQLADDMLDVAANSGEIGKASGADLLEGKLTLPLILLLKHDQSLRPKLEQIMLDGDYSSYSRLALMDVLETTGVLTAVRTRTEEYAEAARKSLDVLAKTEYCSALELLPRFVIDRRM